MTKTNTRSRIVSILLVLMMLLTMVPITAVTANAAEWTTVNSYAELQTAVKNKKEYIQLGRDIDTRDFHYSGGGLDIADWLTFEGQTCTLDLNGKTLSLMTKMKNMPTFMRVYYGSNLTIKDSQGGGQITGEFKNTGADDSYLIHMVESSLTLEGGTFRATAEPYGTNVNVIGYLGSNVTIKDGVTISQPKKNETSAAREGHGYALCDDNINYGPEASNVVIDGGTFDGWVRLMGYQDTNDSVQINSGTFKKGVQLLYKTGENKSAPVVTVNGGTFEDNVYLNGWAWKMSLNMPYRLNGGTFYGSLNLCAETPIDKGDKPKESLNIALGLNECFGYSAIAKHDGVFTAGNIYNAIDWETWDVKYTIKYRMWLKGSASNPVRIIPNAWGMKSVTLDGNPIDYAKDWKGTVERMDNSTAHTLKFEWYPLASELVNAGYSYNARCDHYISGSSAVQQTDTIATGATSHTVTIPAGAPAKVYSYDLHLNLKKSDSPYNIGVYSNEHIVKLVVSEAPVVEPDPTIEGSVYYTSSIVFGRSISTAASVTPAEATKAYQWQRSTNGGSTWTNIDGATRGSYTPVAADMGENVRIRVVVTAEGYLGEIVGAAVKVSKAANNNYPEVIQLEAVKNGAGNYTGFKITNFDSDCEYVYSTTDTPNWSANQISSATVTGLTSDTTYYVFARFKETATHTAGSIVSSNSIKLYDNVPLDRVLLEGYGSHGTIYIKKGDSVTLKVNADPSNANSWKEITFKDEGATTSNIAISNGKINASTGTATPFPNGHTITITGVSTGSANLRASYPSATSSAYGTWNVVVYDDSTVANALRLESVYAYEDITLSENDTADLPINLPKLLPENSGYHLEWRIVKSGMTGFAHLTENDNIKLEDGKIKPKAAHTGSEKTQLELVAVKDGSDTYRTLPKTSLFYVTVTEAPVIELTGVTVAPTKVNLDLNATYQLSAVKEPVNAAGSLVWESSNPGVATVDSTGKVTAKAQGTAIITVSCGDKKDTCTVTVDHQHDYSGQPYLYLDPGNHYQECKAGDGYNIQAHEFTPWTDNGNGTHSRHCTVCKMSDGSTYTETAEHTWVWVVDQEAALNQPGKQHEECTGCHAKRSENTEIPALRDYAVTVTGGTATVAAGTPITRAMEGVEVTVTAQVPDGKHFVKWVAGGVTLANETSATTTFIMPANDVTIKAEFAENPVESYTLTVIKGTASVAAGTPITDKVEQNTVVTVTADAPETGKVFDKWVVLEGNVTLADATKATTTFTMPGNAVKIEATYKDAPPSHTHSYGTEWKYDDTNHWHECQCGDKADTAAHSFQWVIDKAATKEATGIKHEECTVCGAKRSENTVIDKLPDSGNTGNTGSGDNNTDKPGKDDSIKAPQTGDSSNLIGWLAALFVSGGVLTLLGVSGKKRKESEVE